MIVPITHLVNRHLASIRINEEILMVNDTNNMIKPISVRAYLLTGEFIGYVSSKSSSSAQFVDIMRKQSVIGKVWSISETTILIELEK